MNSAQVSSVESFRHYVGVEVIHTVVPRVDFEPHSKIYRVIEKVPHILPLLQAVLVALYVSNVVGAGGSNLFEG